MGEIQSGKSVPVVSATFSGSNPSEATSFPVNFREKPIVAPSVIGGKLDFGRSSSFANDESLARPSSTTSSSLFFRPSKPIEVKSSDPTKGSLFSNSQEQRGWNWVDQDRSVKPPPSTSQAVEEGIAVHAAASNNSSLNLKRPRDGRQSGSEERVSVLSF